MNFLRLLVLQFFMLTSVFSQTYMILDNGKTLTTDEKAFIYDFGNFFLPYNITPGGRNYFFDKESLVTISKEGYVYTKDEKFNLKKIDHKGSNFFFYKNNKELITIDENGYVYVKSAKDFPELKYILVAKGHYFFTRHRNLLKLYVVNHKGEFIHKNLDNIRDMKFSVLGERYFQLKDKTVYTISSEGFVYEKNNQNTGLQISSIVRKGGNYFIDDKGFIFTIDETGALSLPSLPDGFEISKIKTYGSHFMINQDGDIFVVKDDGTIVKPYLPQFDFLSLKHFYSVN